MNEVVCGFGGGFGGAEGSKGRRCELVRVTESSKASVNEGFSLKQHTEERTTPNSKLKQRHRRF